MNLELHFLLYALFAYLVGSISTAIVICRLLGLPDPRSVGSNNPGATNVLRHGGKKAAIITLLGDMLKGLLPVLLVWQLEPVDLAVAVTGFAAFAGHVYPLYYGFRGGKGVATFFGALLGFHWQAGVAAMVIWLIAALLFRYSSLAALIASLGAPLLLFYLTGSAELTAALGVMTVILWWRHRSNMRNLLSGKEHAIGEKKS